MCHLFFALPDSTDNIRPLHNYNLKSCSNVCTPTTCHAHNLFFAFYLFSCTRYSVLSRQWKGERRFHAASLYQNYRRGIGWRCWRLGRRLRGWERLRAELFPVMKWSEEGYGKKRGENVELCIDMRKAREGEEVTVKLNLDGIWSVFVYAAKRTICYENWIPGVGDLDSTSLRFTWLLYYRKHLIAMF